PKFAEGWNHLGVVQALMDDPEAARASWRRALSLKPHLVSARLNLAELALRRDPEGATGQFEELTRRFPGEARAWLGLGKAALALGDTPRARSAFERGIQLHLEEAAFWLGLGETRLRADEYVEARAALAHAMELEPENRRARLLHALAVVDDPA